MLIMPDMIRPVSNRINVPLLVLALCVIGYWTAGLLTGSTSRELSLLSIFAGVITVFAFFVSIKARLEWERAGKNRLGD